jgi:hypothetical protein
MTAPTPDLDYDTIWEAGRADGYEAGRDEFADALAAVTAERDQARQTITAAPHGPHCSSLIPVPDPPRYPCNCWKKELS